MATSREVSPLTFLFTDIEGSTRLWEAHPGAMPGALQEHFGVLQGAVAAGSGTIVADTGDGIFAVFESPREAVGSAVSAQRALGAASWGPSGPLKVRMGIHTGTAVREHGDYHGTDVNRCARLMSTAHGGQVIASEATHRLVRDDPPAGVSFVDLGEHRLKDLARPERIHQVVHADLPTAFPPLRSLGAFPNNLPAALSSFIGRATEIAAVHDALERARLVTLTGAGGAGKTRLALQVAADRVDRHPDGAWLVDLAGLTEPAHVTQTVASALRAPELPGRPPLEALTAYLASRDLLIVLDNCEHVIDAAAAVAEHVLRASPGVRVIATSREPLNVPGEISRPVPSLSLPDESGDWREDDSEAVTLFVERARAADPAFALTRENRAAVATICRRLDGLPLAIELAAARVRALSVDEIAARLHDRFALLTGGARTALPRQRTLEAAVAWSYDLLDERERRLFMRLAIFAGGVELSAIEEVCSDDEIPRGEVLDLLIRLVDKSLVSVQTVAGRTRYRLLETLRDYARNRLAASRDSQALRDAHTRWAIAYAEAAGRQVMGPDQARWLADITASMDDLRSALARSQEQADRESALRIMVGLASWWPIGPVREARQWLERLLTSDEPLSPGLLGPALSLYGVVLAIHGVQDQAAEIQERALALLREVGDARGIAWSMHYLAIARWQTWEPAEVKRLTVEALAAFEALREPSGALRCLWWMILWELEFGTLDEALGYGSRLRDRAAGVPGPLGGAHAAEAAGLLARVQGDVDGAGRLLHQAVRLHASARNPACLSHCLEHVALWSLDREDPDQAAMLLGAVDAIREDVVGSTAVPPFERIWHDRATAASREALGDEGYAAAWERGRAMRIDEATAAGLRVFSSDDEPVAPGGSR